MIRRAVGEALALTLASAWIVATLAFVAGMRAADAVKGVK